MTGPAGALGSVLEMMSWEGFVPGITILIVGWILAKRCCQWIRCTAEVLEAGGFQGFRWSDGDVRQHRTLDDPADVQIMDVGIQVEFYYDHRHPYRWSIELPRRENHAFLSG